MTITSAPEVAAGPEAQLVEKLRAVFRDGRTRPLAWRQAQLAGLGRLLTERKHEITAALTSDLRRTEFEGELFDIAPTQAEVKFAQKHLASWMQPTKVKAPINVQPGKAWYQYEPLGVTLIIAPWNYPVHLALAPLAAAFAAGNCAIVKPSELTPACSHLLADLLPRYVDPDAVKVVEGGPEPVQAILGSGVDHCFFTGSPMVGAAVMAAAAPSLTPVTLELGGKCPAVVTASADLTATARRLAFGKLVNSGQTCVAPDYVLVERSVRDEFVSLLTSTLTTFSEGKRVPIINPRHADRIGGLVASAGGTVALGGTVDVGAAESEVTVIVDPAPAAPILTEEIFGPVMPVITVDSLAEAIEHIGRGSRPLASYLFSTDAAEEKTFLAGVTTGGIVVNHVMMHLAVSDLPFGGVGTSGMGSYHGRWGFETFSYPRAVLSKSSRPDIPLFYPPYSRLAKRIMRTMLDR